MARRLPKNSRKNDPGGPEEEDRQLVEAHIASRPGRSKPGSGSSAASKPRIDSEGLDDFERAFVEAYCLTLDPRRALHLVQEKAGAKLGTRQAAHYHYRKPKVRAAIDRRLAEGSEYSNRLRREVLEALASMLRAQLGDAFAADGKLLEFSKMPLRARVALTELTVKEYEGGKSYRVKMANKLVTVKLLMEHLGMFDAADPMDAERRKIEDAGPELRRRVTELGVRLRAREVLPKPEPGGGEEAPL